GTLRGTFPNRAEVPSASNKRVTFTRGQESQWGEMMERQLLNVSPKAVLTSVDYGERPREYQEAPIEITFNYEIPDYAVVQGNGVMLFKPLLMNNLYNQVRTYLRIDTGLEERKYGFKDSCSRLVELNETTRLPEGYNMAGEGKQDAVQGQAADFVGSLAQEDGKLTLYNHLALKKRVYEASDWENFRRAVEAHKRYGDYLLIKK
ncbi:MAG: transglutaminase, partial [Prevotellaceae bacterium]|nr:transglutaminase [Prevotellaceae bacterium]